MPIRIPVTLPSGAVGSANPGASQPAASGMTPLTSVPSRGPAQHREHFSDKDEPRTWARALNRIQSAVRVVTAIVKAVPFLSQGGNYLSGISFVNPGQTIVKHGLGRARQGYLVLNLSGAATIYALPDQSDGLIRFVASANCTGDAWVW